MLISSWSKDNISKVPAAFSSISETSLVVATGPGRPQSITGMSPFHTCTGTGVSCPASISCQDLKAVTSSSDDKLLSLEYHVARFSPLCHAARQRFLLSRAALHVPDMHTMKITGRSKVREQDIRLFLQFSALNFDLSRTLILHHFAFSLSQRGRNVAKALLDLGKEITSDRGRNYEAADIH